MITQMVIPLRRAGQRSDERPEWDGTGLCEIFSHYSELHTIYNLQTAYFRNFPFNIYRPQVTAESKTADRGVTVISSL